MRFWAGPSLKILKIFKELRIQIYIFARCENRLQYVVFILQRKLFELFTHLVFRGTYSELFVIFFQLVTVFKGSEMHLQLSSGYRNYFVSQKNT